MKKTFLLKSFIFLVIFIIWLSFFTVFSANFFNWSTNLVYKLSNNIYINSNDLNKTLLIYESSLDLSNAKFKSSCNTETNLLNKKNNLFLFELIVNDPNCNDNSFILKSNIWNHSKVSFDLVSDSSLYNVLIDYWTHDLINLSNVINQFIVKYNIYLNFKKSPIDDEYNYNWKKRIYKELVYRWNFIKNLIEKRNVKYLIPIVWKDLPTSNTSKMPNSLRPYRAKITDWIHHSWDIDAPFWEEVISLDDAIIIRIVRNWESSDLKNIRKWEKLSAEDKMRNLDIYRWNQVWIKTMKWELVMYAHLDKILEWLKEWDYVKRWQYIWNVWVSWVPQSDYRDYHLDFWIYENPYNLSKVWSYDIDDYMFWNWKFKWKNFDFIKSNQYEIFEKNEAKK